MAPLQIGFFQQAMYRLSRQFTNNLLSLMSFFFLFFKLILFAILRLEVVKKWLPANKAVPRQLKTSQRKNGKIELARRAAS